MERARFKRLLVLDSKHGNKRRWKLSQYKRDIDVIAERMSLTQSDKEQVMYIIKNFGLNKLHSKATSEQIIVALSFFVKSKNSHHTIDFGWYRVVKEVGLTKDMYIRILTNLLDCYMKLMPLEGLRIVKSDLPSF